MMTAAAIHQFQQHLEDSDATGVLAVTTERFHDIALPDESALATFDLLGVPIGEITIDEVKDTSETTRDVYVSVEGSARKLTYHLEKQVSSFGQAKWLVDDITIRQGTGPKAVEKAVTEQMQLLLGVREAVRAWQQGDPATLVAFSGSRLADKLEVLAPKWRSQVAKQYFGGVLNSKPKAKLVDGEAEVQLSHKDGQLRLILERRDDAAATAGEPWVVKTAVIVGAGKKITHELRREVDLLVAVSSFVNAYAGNDLDRLSQICQQDFYENVLAVADTAQRPLAPAEVFASNYEIRFGKVSNEVSVTVDGVVTQFSALTRDKGRQVDLKIDDVTFFEDGQAVRLTSQLLLVPTIVMFNDALNSGDVPRLRYLTSDNWNVPVWDRFREDRRNILGETALPPFDPEPIDAEAEPMIRYDGSNVEVRQVTGEALVSYKVTTAAHRLVVEDVELVDFRGMRTLRSRLAALCTLDQVADGILMGNVTPVREASTDALQRMTWSLTLPEDLPPHLDLLPLLKAQIHTIEHGEPHTVVTVADRRPIARILMTPDCTQIDDIVFVDGAGQETARFAQSVRQHRVDLGR